IPTSKFFTMSRNSETSSLAATHANKTSVLRPEIPRRSKQHNLSRLAGLRAGTFHTDFTDTSFIVTLSGSSFASDITVSGTVTWAIGIDASLVADLQVAGSGTKGGTLRIEGVWLPPAIAPSASSRLQVLWADIAWQCLFQKLSRRPDSRLKHRTWREYW